MSAAGVEALEVADVSVSFGGLRALSHVNLIACPGEIVALVGPNGSGKTTLLNSVSGFVPVATGTVRVGGLDLTGRPPFVRARVGIGRSLQNPHATQNLRVQDLLGAADRSRFGGSAFVDIARPFRQARAAARRREEQLALLRSLDLPGRVLDTEIRDLSHGTLKLIDIARAIEAATAVLLLDEPTSGLSEHELEPIAELIRKARADGVAVVVVEHNIQFMLGIADRMVVLHKGELLASGEPQATLRQPEVAQAYLGITP